MDLPLLGLGPVILAQVVFLSTVGAADRLAIRAQLQRIARLLRTITVPGTATGSDGAAGPTTLAGVVAVAHAHPPLLLCKKEPSLPVRNGSLLALLDIAQMACHLLHR
jgi:hypothetical protein